jgi:hypothetical protein
MSKVSTSEGIPMRYPGFQIWEVWGHALLLPKDSKAWGAAKHLYEHAIYGVRIMSKFEEFEKNPYLYQIHTIEKAQRARELGKKVMLCLDWHNTTSGSSGYHQSRYIPQNLAKQVERIIRDVKPDVVQVANEPYHIKKGKDLTTKQYAAYVYKYIKGMKAAGFNGLMVAEQSSGDNGDMHDAWEYHVYHNPDNPGALIENWDYCAEGKHRLPRVLHDWKTANHVVMDLNSNAWADRNKPVGWHWPIFQDEFSACGTGIHVDTPEGAKAMRMSLDFFKREKAPFAWLTMGGTSKTFGGEGGWGMHTQLVNSEGKVSESGQAMLRFLGKPQYDGNPVDPPPPGKIDMLEVMAPSSVDFAKTRLIGGRMSTIRDDATRTFVLVKGGIGKSWDWYYWDDEFIYHVITNDGDKDDATAFKSHIAPGVIWCRRFATLGESHVSSPIIHQWANCVQGPEYFMTLASTMLHSRSYTAGELGMASNDVPSGTVCYRLDWRWGPNIENLETFTYAVGWGHLDWDLSGHDVKPFNQRHPKPLVQPDFPCFNVPNWIDKNMRYEGDDPPPPPSGGWHTIFTDRAYLKFNTATAVEALDEINAGKNHLSITQVALMPAELAKVKAELQQIVGG